MKEVKEVKKIEEVKKDDDAGENNDVGTQQEQGCEMDGDEVVGNAAAKTKTYAEKRVEAFASMDRPAEDFFD